MQPPESRKVFARPLPKKKLEFKHSLELRAGPIPSPNKPTINPKKVIISADKVETKNVKLFKASKESGLVSCVIRRGSKPNNQQELKAIYNVINKVCGVPVNASPMPHGVSPVGSNFRVTPKGSQAKISISTILKSVLHTEPDKVNSSRAKIRGRMNTAAKTSIRTASGERDQVESGNKRREKALSESRRDENKVINVSIHHNFNNVCYAPIYIKQDDKESTEKKSRPEGDTRIFKRYSGNTKKRIQKNAGDYSQIVDDVGEFRESKINSSEIISVEGKSCEQSPGPHISLNDPISQEREKIIKYNRQCKNSGVQTIGIRKNGEVPKTTLDFYKFVKLIGKGAFGKVTLGVHKLTGKYVAIKTIDKKYMKDEFSRRKVFQEVYILKKIRHANVIRLLEVFEDATHMLIVMEYAAGGDLLKYVRSKGPLPEQEARSIFRQIVYGLAHIHARSVLHRDIKLDNILLDHDGGVKICDFGVSKIISKHDIIKEQCGTPAYLAPEVITDEGYEGFYIDHWSMGILLYAMLCSSVPFRAKNMKELLDVVRSTPVEFPVRISDSAANLIRSLLRMNPKERLSIPEILAHPWMQEEEDAYENISSMYMNSKDCNDPLSHDCGPSINVVNMGNLFFRELGVEKLAYDDYSYISNDLYTCRIEEEVVKTMEGFGYPRKVVIDGLQKGELNHATATYNLLVLP